MMHEVTVEQFAGDIKTTIENLQKQIIEAGLPEKSADDLITHKEKERLLNYLRNKRDGKGGEGVETKKITLKRKSSSEIKVMQAVQGRNKAQPKMVNIEVRKKRTYVKRSAIDELKKPVLRLVPQPTPEATPDAVPDKVEAAPKDQKKHALESPSVEAKKSQDAAPLQAKPDVDTSPSLPPLPPLQEPPDGEHGAATPPVETETPPAADAPPVTAEADAPPSPPDKKHEEKSTRHGRKELHVALKKSGRRKKKPRRRPKIVPSVESQHGFEKPTEPVVREVAIPDNISVGDLAQRMSIKATEVIKFMMGLGSMVTINQTLDQGTAALVVEEMGHKVKLVSDSALEDELVYASKTQGEPELRAPVVTIMGHVDHGKTSLLDYIRKSRVAKGEAGGITQHIGAYVVETDKGRITFLDTPGHAAFTAMRARGAEVTDIVVVVVAADDGVMPQTEEAIQYSNAANVPVIIAINKIDKANADVERVKQGLSNVGIVPEEWGGDTQCVPVSAETGEGIDDLLDSILLHAELLTLKAYAEGAATGIVIEARLDKQRGPVATALVQSGLLNQGDTVLSGNEVGRIRTMLDSEGNEIESAGPSTPVEVLGLSAIPNAGDEIITVSDEKKARDIAKLRQTRDRESKLAKQQAVKLQNAMNQMGEGKVSTLNILVKADVQGSTEAIVNMLNGFSNEEVKVGIVSSGVGGLTETDINLAITFNAVVIGFNVRADAPARKLADEAKIEIRYYSVIYDLSDDMKASVSGMLTPELREKIIGIAEVKEVFNSQKYGDVAGCIVSSGVIKKSSPIRVLRDNTVVYEGALESLRRFKDDVDEVKSGTECGIAVKNYNNVKSGDQIEVFERIEVTRTI